MRRIFLILFVLLALASAATWYTLQERSAHPQIVWTAGLSPDRVEQVEAFHGWLRANGYVDKDGELLFTVRLETTDNQSALIQAVSGMAGDIFDTFDVLGYQQLGVALDITEDAEKNGYGLDTTYPGMAGLLTGMDGRQYAYPCNGASVSMWINLSTLEKYGFKRPPLEWTPEEFEAMGKEYVKRANEGLPRQEYFFIQALDSGWGVNMAMCIARSKGWDIYNETLTRSVADNEPLKHAIKLFHKWTYVDRIAPTAADVASMNTDAGYGGADFSNFISGKYAMIVMGRYCLIRFREVQQQKDMTIQFAVSQLPMYDYKNHPITVRAAMPYRGSKRTTSTSSTARTACRRTPRSSSRR